MILTTIALTIFATLSVVLLAGFIFACIRISQSKAPRSDSKAGTGVHRGVLATRTAHAGNQKEQTVMQEGRVSL